VRNYVNVPTAVHAATNFFEVLNTCRNVRFYWK